MALQISIVFSLPQVVDLCSPLRNYLTLGISLASKLVESRDRLD